MFLGNEGGYSFACSRSRTLRNEFLTSAVQAAMFCRDGEEIEVRRIDGWVGGGGVGVGCVGCVGSVGSVGSVKGEGRVTPGVGCVRRVKGEGRVTGRGLCWACKG